RRLPVDALGREDRRFAARDVEARHGPEHRQRADTGAIDAPVAVGENAGHELEVLLLRMRHGARFARFPRTAPGAGASALAAAPIARLPRMPEKREGSIAAPPPRGDGVAASMAGSSGLSAELVG